MKGGGGEWGRVRESEGEWGRVERSGEEWKLMANQVPSVFTFCYSTPHHFISSHSYFKFQWSEMEWMGVEQNEDSKDCSHIKQWFMSRKPTKGFSGQIASKNTIHSWSLAITSYHWLSLVIICDHSNHQWYSSHKITAPHSSSLNITLHHQWWGMMTSDDGWQWVKVGGRLG